MTHHFRPDSWLQPRPYTDPSLRRMKHGRILPLDEPAASPLLRCAQVALGEMRNGYFFQSVMFRGEERGKRHQTIAMHVSHRGRNYAFSLQAPEGELTYAVISVLNPFLDSLTLR